MAKSTDLDPEEVKWYQKLQSSWPHLKDAGYWPTLEENLTRWKSELAKNDFWQAVRQNWVVWRNEYYSDKASYLFHYPKLPKFRAKEASRIKDKLYRKREEFDKANKEFLPGLLYLPNINDLVRTRVECNYLDGIEFLSAKFIDLAQSLNIKHRLEKESKETGYYAQHFYILQEITVKNAGKTSISGIECELQIATALSSHIWRSTHPTYEQYRSQQVKSTDWQWNPDDPRFIATHIGHATHLVDGLILKNREEIS